MKIHSKLIITSDRLVNLFSLFVVGTLSYVFLTILLPLNVDVSWWSGLIKGLIFTVIPETLVIFGLVIAILIIGLAQ